MKGASILILSLLATLFVAELGLRTAAWFNLQLTLHASESGAVSDGYTLLIGDSILGTMSDEKTPAGQFFANVRGVRPDFQAIELTVGGLTSMEARTRLTQTLAKNTISTAVIMLGKSDATRGIVDAKLGPIAHSFYGGLELTKVAMIIALDLQKQILNWKPDRQALAQHAEFKLPWALYREKKIEAIEAFEKSLRKYPDYVRAIRAVVHTYYLHGKLAEGIKFLEELKGISAEVQLIEIQISYLKADQAKAQGDIRTAPDDGWQDSLLAISDHRMAYISRLRMAHILENAELFAEEFRAMSPQQSEVFLPSTLANLNAIIDALLLKKIRVILVEYPSNDAQALRRALAQYGSAIEIYDSRKWLLDGLENPSLIKGFQPDCDHLSLLGAQVFGKSLTKIFLEQ